MFLVHGTSYSRFTSVSIALVVFKSSGKNGISNKKVFFSGNFLANFWVEKTFFIVEWVEKTLSPICIVMN